MPGIVSRALTLLYGFNRQAKMIQYSYRQRKSFSLYSLCILFLATGLTFYPVDNCFSISNSDYFYLTPTKISDDWETASIYEANINAEKLFNLIHNIRNDSYKNIHSLLLVKDGKLILEEYFHGFHHEKAHQIRSATKSIGSILTGIAIDHHFIEGAYEKIYPYFKGYEICQKWNETVKGVYMARYF